MSKQKAGGVTRNVRLNSFNSFFGKFLPHSIILLGSDVSFSLLGPFFSSTFSSFFGRRFSFLSAVAWTRETNFSDKRTGLIGSQTGASTGSSEKGKKGKKRHSPKSVGIRARTCRRQRNEKKIRNEKSRISTSPRSAGICEMG